MTQRASKLIIKNFKGIRELDLGLAPITVISGRNGVGKSSVLNSIQALVKGGHDASLIRKGAEKAEVKINLENGTGLEMVITKKGKYVDVDYSEVLEDTPPMTYVKTVSDELAVHPTRYIFEEKKRKEWLLTSLPVKVSEEQLLEAIETVGKRIPDRVKGLTAVEAIDSLIKPIYENRTKLNRDVKSKEGSIKEMFDELPDEYVEEEKIAAAATAKREEAQRLDRERNSLVQETRQEYQEERDRLKEEAEEKINAIKQQLSQDLEQLRAEEVASVDELATEYDPQAEEAHREAERLSTEARNAARTNAAIKIAKRSQDELEKLKEEASAHTTAIERLRALKEEVLKSIPIPGIEVRDGELYKDGIPFDNLNTATQDDIILQIAAMRAGPLGLVCFDGLEALDQEHKTLLFDRILSMQDQDLRFIFTERTEEPELTITQWP